MTERAKIGIQGVPWRPVGWGGAAALWLLPLIAMRFTDEVRWDETDFLVFGAMLLAAGLACETLARRSANVAYRAGGAVAVAAAFVLVWANLAVGIVGSEDNPINIIFTVPLAVGLAGAIPSRFKAPGMAWAMVATAIAQLLAGGAALALADADTPVLTLVFVGLWLGSAALFRRAAREEALA